MKKTLLLVFIHGFKGDDDTFKKFPQHIKILLEDALPKINIVSITYPKYETRGDLSSCVSSFKEWLQNKVIDLEVAAKTPSPTIEPSVRVILVGHSMGGIVAAETLLSIARDQTDHPPTSSTPPPGVGSNKSTSARAKSRGKTNLSTSDVPQRPSSAPPRPTTSPTSNPETGSADPQTNTPTSLFPFVQGILAFDTPFLGVHPGVIAHGTEAHLNTASAAYNAYNSASKMFGFGGGGSSPKPNASRASPSSQQNSGGGWGNLAMYAGGAAALAAAGGAAWAGRNQISEGWSWATSHLEFVGCLARGAELAQRLDAIAKLSQRCNTGLANFYCRLGDQGGKSDYSGKLLGEERTFCVVPKQHQKSNSSSDAESPSKKRKIEEKKIEGKGTWIECVNKKANDEITAHRSMFRIEGHPGYYAMADKAKGLVVEWLDSDWYESSQGTEDEEQNQKNRDTEAENAKEESDAAKASAEAQAEESANAE